MESKNVNVIKPTLFVSFFSLLNYGLAFLTQVITARYYGNNLDRDAYLVALTIPSYIISIFVTALPSVYLPLLIDLRNESVEKSWQFARDVFIVFFAGLLIITIICGVFSAHIIKLIAPEISAKALSLAVSLYIIILPSIVLNVLSGLLGSLYYSCYKFLRPSLAPVINSLVTLICVLAFSHSIGVYSLGVGFLSGSLAGFLFLFPIAEKFPRSLNLRDQYLGKFFSTVAPLIFAGIIYQSVTIVQRRYASMLPIGSISSLGYSMQIITALASVLSGGISTILFPLMSNSWAQKDLNLLRKYFSAGVIVILVLAIPFVVFFYFLGLPFIKVVFERGAFNQQDSVVVSSTMFVLSGALVFYSLGNIVAKGFYFSGKTSWGAIQEILILLVYLYLGRIFSEKWSLIGLALATTVTSGLSVISSFLFMSYLIQGVDIGRITLVTIQVVVAAIVSGVVSFEVYTMGLQLGDLLALVLAIILQILIYYFVVVFLFKIQEMIFIQRKIIDYIRNILFVF